MKKYLVMSVDLRNGHTMFTADGETLFHSFTKAVFECGALEKENAHILVDKMKIKHFRIVPSTFDSFMYTVVEV